MVPAIGVTIASFCTRERIEQRRFADVRLSREHHRHSFPQKRALTRVREHRFKPLTDARELAARVGGFEKVDLFFGEVERRFNEHPQIDHVLDERVNFARERAFERAARRPRSRLGAGLDQIGDGLRLGEIELVVQKCAASEFARFRDPKPEAPADFDRPLQNELQYDRPAVTLQLQHMLARV